MPGPVRWVLFDPTNSSSYSFHINPKAGGSPLYRKSMTYMNTLAPGGKVLMFEGQTEPQNVEFSGVILEQAQYDALALWFNKRYQLQLTDDLGRVFIIYITEYTPTREWSRSHQWRHSYTVKYTIMSQLA